MILFHYYSNDSLIHRLNPVTKLLAMLVFGISTITLKSICEDWLSFIIFAGLVLFLYYKAGVSLRQCLRELPYFLHIIPLIILFSAFRFSNSEELFLNHIYLPGLITSTSFVLKLVLISMISILFIATTTIREINYAVEVLLKKIPFVNSVKIATMISLVIIQIPIIFDLYHQITIAQKSRCLDNRKNPLRKTIILLNILIHKVLLNADSIALNYEAKCYSEERTDNLISIPKFDILAITSFVIFCLAVNLAKLLF